MGGTGVIDRFLEVFTRYIDSGLPPAVHRDLVVYAEALARETGAVVEPLKLIAPMLERFMATDRAFSKVRRTLPAAPATTMGGSSGAPPPASEPNSESA